MQMRTEVLKTGARRLRAGRIAFVAAAFVVGAFVIAPASAQLPLDLDLPTLPPLPLPLPTLAPLDEEASGSVDGVVDTLNSIPDQLGAIVPGPSKPVAPAPNPMPGLKPTKVDAWSIERLPALSRTGYASNVPPTTISSFRLARPGSYTSVVGDGFRAAAGRAAHLIGPLAAPLLVALFAILTLALAARGPGRLVKVEEDRQGFRDRRSYRL
jgi:hypothetical protein